MVTVYGPNDISECWSEEKGRGWIWEPYIKDDPNNHCGRWVYRFRVELER